MIHSPTTVGLVNAPGLVITDLLQWISVTNKQTNKQTPSAYLIKASAIFASVSHFTVIRRLRIVRHLGPLTEYPRDLWWDLWWDLGLAGPWTRLGIRLPTTSCAHARHNTSCLQYSSLLCLDFAGGKGGGKGGCEDGLKGDAKGEEGSGSTLKREGEKSCCQPRVEVEVEVEVEAGLITDGDQTKKSYLQLSLQPSCHCTCHRQACELAHIDSRM